MPKTIFIAPYVPNVIVNKPQNLNNDKELRKIVTKHYQDKIIEWIKNDKDFKKFNNKKKFLKSIDGLNHIYKIIRIFVKKNYYNWYDLRSKHYYQLKDYLRFQL